MIGIRPSWRSVAATWGGAVFLLMRQFGVPTPSATMPETRIVRVSEVGEQLGLAERTPDGRILTLPVELDSRRQRQDHPQISELRYTVN